MRKVEFDIRLRPSKYNTSPAIPWEGYEIPGTDPPLVAARVPLRDGRGGYVPGAVWCAMYQKEGIRMSNTAAATRERALQAAYAEQAVLGSERARRRAESAVVRHATRWLTLSVTE